MFDMYRWERQCVTCFKFKLLTEFSPLRDDYQRKCKECRNRIKREQWAEMRLENPLPETPPEVLAERERKKKKREFRQAFDRIKGRQAELGKKWCPYCQRFKEFKLFSIDRHRVDGLQIYCKECNMKMKRMSLSKVEAAFIKKFLSNEDPSGAAIQERIKDYLTNKRVIDRIYEC